MFLMYSSARSPCLRSTIFMGVLGFLRTLSRLSSNRRNWKPTVRYTFQLGSRSAFIMGTPLAPSWLGRLSLREGCACIQFWTCWWISVSNCPVYFPIDRNTEIACYDVLYKYKNILYTSVLSMYIFRQSCQSLHLWLLSLYISPCPGGIRLQPRL